MTHLYIENSLPGVLLEAGFKGRVGVKAEGLGVPGSRSERPIPGRQVAQKGEVGPTKAISRY